MKRILLFLLLLAPLPAGAQTVWINEVRTDLNGVVVGGDNGEFVELVGAAGTTLTGYEVVVTSCDGTLQDVYTVTYTFTDETNGYGFYVIGDPAGGVVPDQDTKSVPAGSGTFDGGVDSNSDLPDAEGAVLLRDGTGTSVFQYAYGNPACGGYTYRGAPDPAGGASVGFTTASAPGDGEPATLLASASPGASNTGQTLPVELVSFEALVDGAGVLLRWTTASETNNAGFDVEYAAADAPFERVAFVEGRGTTTEGQAYTHRVAELAPGTYRFRLRQVDFDGAFAYTPEVEVTVVPAEAFALSPVYPNPFGVAQATFTLVVARAQHVRVALYDVLGRRLRVLHAAPLAAGAAHTFRLDAGDLPGGVYLVRAAGEDFAAVRAVTLLR